MQISEIRMSNCGKKFAIIYHVVNEHPFNCRPFLPEHLFTIVMQIISLRIETFIQYNNLQILNLGKADVITTM